MATEWVLISGAASGIGAELCRLLAREGSGLVMVDKDARGLEERRAALSRDFDVPLIALVYDLSRPDAPAQIHDELQGREVEIDVLINNAGFGTYGNFWESDAARETALVGLNIMAPMLLTRLFLPGMVARRRGRILNVGSIAGFAASPHATTYYGSKAWLLSFSQGLQAALRGTGVTATIVCPGPTYTAFNWHAAADKSKNPPPRQRFQMDASEVASQALHGMRRGQMIVIPGRLNKFLALLAKLLPRRVALWLVKVG